MSAFKQFNSQDLIVSPFEVNKGFKFVGGEALTSSIVGIDRYLGRSGKYIISGSDVTGNIAGQQIPKVLPVIWRILYIVFLVWIESLIPLQTVIQH